MDENEPVSHWSHFGWGGQPLIGGRRKLRRKSMPFQKKEKKRNKERKRKKNKEKEKKN